MVFDLDDTLLDRENAVDRMFLMILEKCYEVVNDSTKNIMLQKFKEYDKSTKDINGCQNVNIKGIWFNPHMTKNDTTILPFAEIHSFDGLLDFLHNRSN
ncbi:hypothetical protein [Solibacillus sp. FSL K6-4121]|uniref:hypothetical protein n=1 Tax=Solibacillus sp. FSL K6-4121 TaxID=2921505 RepID=UPI0030F680E6